MKKSELKKLIRESIKELMNEQMCPNGQDQNALNMLLSTGGNPQLGDHGISQNFVNNMAGKSTQFYTDKAFAFRMKAIQLNGGAGEMLCKGRNPKYQAQLSNRADYALNCKNNPGTC